MGEPGEFDQVARKVWVVTGDDNDTSWLESVHATEESAKKEAERLHGAQKAGYHQFHAEEFDLQQ